MHIFSPNTVGRDFIVGDLHGCYSLLLRALESVKFDFTKDRLISLGDLIDRGDESQWCLSLLDEPWFMAVKGNHEDMFTKVLESEACLQHFIASGGSWLLDVDTTGFDGFSSWYSYWSKRVADLPVAAELPLAGGIRIGLVHGECLQSNWDDICPHDEGLLWGRIRYRHRIDTRVNGIDHIFCGHTITREPITYGNTTYLDTGAHKNGVIALADLSKYKTGQVLNCIMTFS